MSLRSFLIRAVILILPGVFFLAGGPSPVRGTAPEILDLADVVAENLYPDDWVTLFICSVLICLPGVLFVVGADYLEEIAFWRIPVNTTPGAIWRGLGYILAVAAAALALVRLIGD